MNINEDRSQIYTNVAMYVIYPRKDVFNINLLVDFVLKWQAGYSSFFFVLMAKFTPSG